jgi:ABC-type Mn2+/Zn2+ transport system permease subunit
MQAVSLLVSSLAMAAAAGLVGSVAVMRRMTLASDAISHVALPGIGLAMLLGFNPVLGGVLALFAGILLVWGIERKTRIPTEAVIGVVFSAALAVGSMLTNGEELIEALFGSGRIQTSAELLAGLVTAGIVIAFCLLAGSRLVIALVSPDIARTAGIDVSRLDLLYLLAFALTVALGLRYLGVLLMGSLIIIPATTAKHLSRNLRQMCGLSVAIAMASTLAGSLLAQSLRVPAGPLTITLAAAVFFLGLLRRAVA